ncbi:hypothetical protein [Persephonella sp.]
MKAVKNKQQTNREILEKIKNFLEKEGIKGEFTIVKDEDIKNGYTVVIKAKNIKSFDKRLKKSHELNQKGSHLISGRYLFYIIQPS